MTVYADDAYMAYLNEEMRARITHYENIADSALMMIINEGITQVVHIPKTPITLLFRPYALSLVDGQPKYWGQFAVIAISEHDVTFTNDPWYWEGLTYRERPATPEGGSIEPHGSNTLGRERSAIT